MTNRSALRADFVELGLRRNDLVMVHAGIRSVGGITGGVNELVLALFDVLGPDGTIAAYVDFEPFWDEDSDPQHIPVFDKRTASAARDHGVLHETLRTWPGAMRSDHPDAGVVAIGRLASVITADHPFQYGYGEGSPFEKIVNLNGRVLMIGAPLDTISLIHFAEHKAKMEGKRIHRYRRLMPGISGPKWVDFEEFDTREPVCDSLPPDCFERIAIDYLASGSGKQGRVGNATSFLFEGAELVHFAVRWLEDFTSRTNR